MIVKIYDHSLPSFVLFFGTSISINLIGLNIRERQKKEEKINKIKKKNHPNRNMEPSFLLAGTSY